MLPFTLHFKFYLIMFLLDWYIFEYTKKFFRNIHFRKKLPIIAKEL